VIPSGRRIRERPSHRELSKKLAGCLKCVREQCWLPADPAKLKANWDELEEACDIESATLQEEQAAILLGVLGEVKPEHYAGKRPPERSYEGGTGGPELFAFRWNSIFFGHRKMYFKFSLIETKQGSRAIVYSIHPNRERDLNAD
jgi:hypothetical protein